VGFSFLDYRFPQEIATIVWQLNLTVALQSMTIYASFWSTRTSIKGDGVKLTLWSQISPVTEMMRSCKCFPHVSKINGNPHV
jgi:hypothetical protein